MWHLFVLSELSTGSVTSTSIVQWFINRNADDWIQVHFPLKKQTSKNLDGSCNLFDLSLFSFLFLFLLLGSCTVSPSSVITHERGNYALLPFCCDLALCPFCSGPEPSTCPIRKPVHILSFLFSLSDPSVGPFISAPFPSLRLASVSPLFLLQHFPPTQCQCWCRSQRRTSTCTLIFKEK